MNKKIILMGITSMLLAACGRPSDTPAPPGPNPQGCSSHQLKLHLTNNLHVTPQGKKCVVAGAIITMEIKNPNGVEIDLGWVTTGPKPGNPTTLLGANSIDVNSLTFSTPSDASVGDEFSYWVDVQDFGNIDPIVKVVSHAMYLKASEWDQKHYEKELLDLPAETTKD